MDVNTCVQVIVLHLVLWGVHLTVKDGVWVAAKMVANKVATLVAETPALVVVLAVAPVLLTLNLK